MDSWERGEAQHPLHRALTLLQAGNPEQSLEELASLPIGERDRRLIALRREWVGSRFEAVSACPHCGEQLEFSLEAADFPLAPAPASVSLTLEGRTADVRVPTTLDILAAVEAPAEERRAVLISRCAGEHVATEAGKAVEECLSKLDPMLDVGLDLACPACGHQWRSVFDIAGYFWTEIADHARRLLREVNILAQAYGWTEPEILALSARRRRMYLGLVLGG